MRKDGIGIDIHGNELWMMDKRFISPITGQVHFPKHWGTLVSPLLGMHEGRALRQKIHARLITLVNDGDVDAINQLIEECDFIEVNIDDLQLLIEHCDPISLAAFEVIQ